MPGAGTSFPNLPLVTSPGVPTWAIAAGIVCAVALVWFTFFRK